MEANLAECSKFATLALIDLETCNLPIHNHNKTAITEMCIYAFAIENMVIVSGFQTMDENMPMPPTPRVLHKLTLLLNPRMMVDPITEKITGLNNYMLEAESAFDENAANTVLGFLHHLQQPVCLVAHNGWNFDFPIIKKTFQKLQKTLPDNMICVDSLRAFLEIDKKRQLSNTADVVDKSTSTTVTLQSTIEEHKTFINDDECKESVVTENETLVDNCQFKIPANDRTTLEKSLSDDEIQILEDALNENSTTVTLQSTIEEQKTFVNDDECKESVVTENETVVDDCQFKIPANDRITLEKSLSDDEIQILEDALNENSQFNWRTFNETTPKRNTAQLERNGKRKLFTNASSEVQQATDGVTTENQQSEAKKPTIESFSLEKRLHSKTRRRLHFDADASPAIKKYPPRGIYKLGKMYKRIFGESPVNAHHAEADVEMLMRLVLHYGEDFVAYAEQHAIPFSDVPRLGRGHSN